jgi:GntR family transcriptional regulator
MIVTIMDVKVTRDEPIPLHEQVAAEIRRDIAEGQVRPGQRLPPARDMAAVLGVHPNTVFRALRTLRDEGILDFQRGRSVTVAGTPERSAVLAKVRELIDFARAQGYRREDLVTMIESLR